MWYSSPANYAHTITNGRWLCANHLALIDTVVTDLIYQYNFPINRTLLSTWHHEVKNKLPRILIIEAPPRHGKSEYISKYLPSWFLSMLPHKNVILTSYAKELSRNFGRYVKQNIEYFGPKYFGIDVKDDKAAASDWGIQTLSGTQLGGMLSSGIGGAVTGFGAHLFIIDDFCKNAEEALSEKIRDKWWDTFQSTLQTRLEPNAVIVIIATRWHSDDLIGRLTGDSDQDYDWSEPYIRIRLPAIAEDSTQLDQEYINKVLQRNPGDALWPDRYNITSLESTMTNLDDYWWNSLYQQNPGRSDRIEWPDSYFTNLLINS